MAKQRRTIPLRQATGADVTAGHYLELSAGDVQYIEDALPEPLEARVRQVCSKDSEALKALEPGRSTRKRVLKDKFGVKVPDTNLAAELADKIRKIAGRSLGQTGD